MLVMTQTQGRKVLIVTTSVDIPGQELMMHATNMEDKENSDRIKLNK